jgi:hypothetical protein
MLKPACGKAPPFAQNPFQIEAALKRLTHLGKAYLVFWYTGASSGTGNVRGNRLTAETVVSE